MLPNTLQPLFGEYLTLRRGRSPSLGIPRKFYDPWFLLKKTCPKIYEAYMESSVLSSVRNGNVWSEQSNIPNGWWENVFISSKLNQKSLYFTISK